jgi:hypothetical protein
MLSREVLVSSLLYISPIILREIESLKLKGFKKRITPVSPIFNPVGDPFAIFYHTISVQPVKNIPCESDTVVESHAVLILQAFVSHKVADQVNRLNFLSDFEDFRLSFKVLWDLKLLKYREGHSTLSEFRHQICLLAILTLWLP